MEYNATETTMEYNKSGNDAEVSSINSYMLEYNLAIPLVILHLHICLLGLVGNGFVIYFLGFRIKRNPFTTYVWNLSIADAGVLTVHSIDVSCLFLQRLYHMDPPYFIVLLLRFSLPFTVITSQLLLTVISIDRCVCLYFPLWHRCHRPSRFSTAVCIFIWIFVFLFNATYTSLTAFGKYYGLVYHPFLLNAVLLMPIMCGSTVAMSIKGCSGSAKWKQRKLLRAIWITLVCFLLFAFPMNIFIAIFIFYDRSPNMFLCANICVSLNSAINPIIYYLVGVHKRGRSSKKIKKVLEKLFKEEEDSPEEQDTSTNPQL